MFSLLFTFGYKYSLTEVLNAKMPLLINNGTFLIKRIPPMIIIAKSKILSAEESCMLTLLSSNPLSSLSMFIIVSGLKINRTNIPIVKIEVAPQIRIETRSAFEISRVKLPGIGENTTEIKKYNPDILISNLNKSRFVIEH